MSYWLRRLSGGTEQLGLSKVINELLREGLSSGGDEILQLIYSEKLVCVDEEEFRRGMSRRFEER